MGSKVLSPDEVMPHSVLSVEYISLIVIILSFVVGVFSRQMQSAPRGVTHSPSPAMINTRPLKTITMRKIFSPGSAILRKRMVKPWAMLLARHDIKVSAVVGSGALSSAETDSDKRWAMAIARSVSLRRFLEKEGVPSGALSIVAVVQGPGALGRMRLFKEGA